MAAGWLSARLHRHVRFDGGVSVRPTLQGVELSFRDGHVGRPAWAGPGDALAAQAGRVRFAWTSVLHLTPVAASVELDHPVLLLTRDLQGRPDWFSGPDARELSQPIVVRRLRITGGRLVYVDLQGQTRLEAQVSADPDAADGLGLHVDGAGSAPGGPWRVTFRAPARRIGERGDLPLRLTLAQAGSRLLFRGVLPGALDVGRLSGVIEGEGADLHDLAQLTHVPFPHTAPYRLQGRLRREGPAFHLEGLQGRTGSTPVAGAITVRQDGDGRRLDGAFTTPDLSLGDLLVLVSGGRAGTGRPPAAGPKRLIPDAGVNAVRLRTLNGVVTLDAAAVRPTGGMAVRRLSLRATFDHGRIAAAPLVLNLPHGRTVWNLGLDVRRLQPTISLDLQLQGAPTTELLGAAGARAPVRAVLDGRVRLRGTGPTLHAAAAHASGDARLSARGGTLGRIQAEVLGGDLRGAFAGLLSHDRATAPLLCLQADFDAENGQAWARRLVFATPAGTVTGRGSLDLGAETVDLVLTGEPAHPGLSRPGGYVSLQGPLAHPRAAFHAGGVLGVLRSLLSLAPAPGPVRLPTC